MATKRAILGPSVAGPSPARDMYVSRIGSALNPRRISSILAMADQGQPAAWHDLLNELRQKDGVLHSVLQTREAALLGCPWAVQPVVLFGKSKPTRKAEKVAALCAEWLRQIPDLDRALAHLTDAIFKGYSVCEITWKRQGRYLVPAGLHPIQGRRFAFDDGQNLRLYDDGLRPWPGDDIFALHPYRFLAHQPRVNGDSPTREGLGRVLVWLSCFASWSWRDWMLFAELFGKPWRILTLDREKVQVDDESAAESIVQDATSSTSILLYENMKLDVKWPDAPGGASASPSPAILDKVAQYIALATLGQLGTTGNVQNGLGGKGDAREKVRGDILHSDGVGMASTLRRLVTMMVALNFGAAEPVPPVAFTTDDVGDTEKAARVLDAAVNKLRLPVGSAHAYAALGIPAPGPGEELVTGAAAKPTAPGQPTPPDPADNADESADGNGQEPPPEPPPNAGDEATDDDQAP